MAKSGEDTFKNMLTILGIQVSTSAHKDFPFAPVSEALGIRIDFSQSESDLIVVSPKVADKFCCTSQAL